MTPPLFLYVSLGGIADVCKIGKGDFSGFLRIFLGSFFDVFKKNYKNIFDFVK